MAAAPAGAQNRCVFVGNIPYDATEEQLVQICEEVGPVVSFRLVIDKETGKPKGYGFCEYKDEETALSARRNLQGYEINGRQLRVDFAENGRNTDRNREKVEDPKFFTVEPFLPPMEFSVDMRSYGQKQLAATSVGDASLHQPVGLPSAIHAASVMAGVLGGAQTANVQNGLPVQYGLGNDPLTHYLARMSRHQLHEIMAELKGLTTRNKELSKKLLEGIPHLPKALFQMQMAKNQQPSSSLAQSSTHLNEQANMPPNPTVLPEQTATLHTFPPYQHSSQPPVKVFPHGHQSGLATHPPILSQPLGGSSSVPTQPLVASVGFMSHIQPPFMPQHPRPPVMPTSVQQLQVAAGVETLPGEIRMADQASHLAEFAHPSKLRKLEDGTSVPGMVNSSHLAYAAPPQAVGPDGPSGSYSAGAVSSQQPGSEAQLTPDIESALLQQVLQLTPEQLSSLPPEQQQQVIELQKMLSAGK
ncbi:hypothetical protein HU200_016887 [Digitaria exilis]|uniref:Cleavage stimulating factor 64 n=1 Tax=Digitaria exilis TaxID=1010633 RepID=A0A835KKT9_9POAL|nr:hypothetical protein HU200_016887 [Digitaria exilis]